MATVAASAWRQPVGGLGLHAKQGHHPVTRELIGNPARLLDGAADNIKVAIQEEHHIVGQFILSQAGKAAQVGEQDGGLLLLPSEIAGLGKAITRLRLGWEERDHRQVAQSAVPGRPAGRSVAPQRS